MTVQELMDELRKHDPALEVVVSGYEGGTTSLTSVNDAWVDWKATHPSEWWYGRHSDAHATPETMANPRHVVYLPR